MGVFLLQRITVQVTMPSRWPGVWYPEVIPLMRAVTDASQFLQGQLDKNRKLEDMLWLGECAALYQC